jgi:hypothetical protein
LTQEEREEMEKRAFEEEKRREAIREREPQWNLYCILDEKLNE